jgi:hypothetical protein
MKFDKIVMPGFMPGIHVLKLEADQDVDGRDEPGHDGDVVQSRGIPL